MLYGECIAMLYRVGGYVISIELCSTEWVSMLLSVELCYAECVAML